MKCPRNGSVLVCGLIAALLCACDREPPVEAARCDPDADDLVLPRGFCATVVADNIANARNLAVRSNGDLYVISRNWRLGLGSLLAAHDSDGDGRMDVIERIADQGGVDLEIHQDMLLVGRDEAIYRYPLSEALLPGEPEIIATGFPQQDRHRGKAFAVDPEGWLYVNVGAPSNACQRENRTMGSPGKDPCPELARHAGIWRFRVDRLGQSQQEDGERFAGGIRNAYALAWNAKAGALYAVQHGRDELHELWPRYYSQEDGADLPAEEMIRVEAGREYGWPYCYFDQRRGEMVLAPEYGGNGTEIGRCAEFPRPLIGFPGHYSPNDMVFYRGEQFPEPYRSGAFIAFHGSYNRIPEQAGYQVVFVPFTDGRPSGAWEVFADGFAGPGPVTQPEDALHRPTGLALGPDGSLYVLDSVSGRTWRIDYLGE